MTTIDGGTGDDIAVFSQAKVLIRSRLGYNNSSSQFRHRRDDTLTNIEFLKFSDGYYDVDDLSTNLGGTALQPMMIAMWL